MILLNFSHPLTPEHLDQIASLTGQKVEWVIDVNSQVDQQQALVPQAVALADRCGLSPMEWQTLPILINPPSLHWVAVVLLAEIHGRCGYFPAHLRLRPAKSALPFKYEVDEVVDLQSVRDKARQRRN